MKHFFTFSINNQGTQSWYQSEHDGPVTVSHSFPNTQPQEVVAIPPQDMVMLASLYHYVKENDIQNDFINPAGKNREGT